MPRKRKENAEPSAAEKRAAVLTAVEETYAEEGNLLHDLFRNAVTLDRRKRAIFAEVAKNRRSLRDLAGQGLASVEDVNALYPPKASNETEDDTPEAA